MQRGDQSDFPRIFWLKKGQVEERWENFIGELPEERWVKKIKGFNTRYTTFNTC